MSRRGIHKRLAKLARWIGNEPLAGVASHPFPWREKHTPYYVQYPLENADGHGGYTRLYRFDADGVPFRTSADDAPLYDPLVVARYARRMHAIGSEHGDSQAQARARALLAPLMASAGAEATWDIGASATGMQGTPHANVQGEVISTLLRLHDGAPDRETRETLARACASLWRPVEDGGCRTDLYGGPFLEEYPRSQVRHVLGGCITGLFGLYDIADVLADSLAIRAARELEEHIARLLPRFLTPSGWSLYALDVHGVRYRASLHYHQSRAFKLRVIDARRPDLGLGGLLDKWEAAPQNAGRRLHAAFEKSAQVFWLRYVRRLPLREA